MIFYSNETHYSNRKIDLKEGAKTVKVKAKLMTYEKPKG